ncbi:unnamed protein product [Candidula unifasciata]|uniref:Dynein heavy chain coiled coil stalk domain-containing protein n=1 Tax=Candidula unifasciata TaxID=100452 RepID=A0A8S3YHQ1_9EUPU|nr:unnamed protein product [Candidula unifasciata]
MGCGGSKNTNTKDATEYDDEDYDAYSPTNKTSTQNSPRRHYNNNTNYGNYNSNTGSPYRSGGTQTSPVSKYALNNNGSADEFPEANDKQGYKRRIRNDLIRATSGSKIEDIEKNIEKFEKNHMEDCGDLTRAKERLQYLKLKRDLRDAIRRSNAGVLERTIAEAENSRYAGQLRPQIEAAERKLEHLRELNKYSHDILTMDQATISEIHSYHRPPACVHDVMAASYMLLGHDESTLRDWSYLQSMAGKVGKDSLIHAVREFDSSNVDEATAKRVREILNYHDLGEVRVASNGAATFHVWASNIVDKIDKDREEENKRRQQT